MAAGALLGILHLIVLPITHLIALPSHLSIVETSPRARAWVFCIHQRFDAGKQARAFGCLIRCA